jgi:hypothetical protein
MAVWVPEDAVPHGFSGRLIVATAMSVTGNVAHPVLHAPRAR